jgi:hypothetical protein
MHQYLVCYDLTKPLRDYPAIARRLTNLGYQRVLLSQWIGAGAYTAQQLKADLLGHMDASDRLLILDITDAPEASYNLI